MMIVLMIIGLSTQGLAVKQLRKGGPLQNEIQWYEKVWAPLIIFKIFFFFI